MKKVLAVLLITTIIVSTNTSAIARSYMVAPVNNAYSGQYSIQTETPDKNKYIAALLAIIMMHQFYLGNTKTGLLYWVAVLIFGLGYAVSVLDCLTLLFMEDEKFQAFMQADNLNTIPVLYALFDGEDFKW